MQPPPVNQNSTANETTHRTVPHWNAFKSGILIQQVSEFILDSEKPVKPKEEMRKLFSDFFWIYFPHHLDMRK